MFREMAFIEVAARELAGNKEMLKEADKLLFELFDGRLKRQQLVNGVKYMVQATGSGNGFTCRYPWKMRKRLTLHTKSVMLWSTRSNLKTSAGSRRRLQSR